MQAGEYIQNNGQSAYMFIDSSEYIAGPCSIRSILVAANRVRIEPSLPISEARQINVKVQLILAKSVERFLSDGLPGSSRGLRDQPMMYKRQNTTVSLRSQKRVSLYYER
jgi:hypothetical protein